MKLGRMFLVFATALLLCCTAATASATSYSQRKMYMGKFPIHSACMMPPQAQLIKVGVKGAEGMTKEGEAWAAVLEGLVETHLKVGGIKVNSATNPLSSGASDDEIRGTISQIQQKFKIVSALVEKKPMGIVKLAYTLSDQVGMLPCSENSDILVFVRGEGQVLTGARSTMTFAIGGPTEDNVLLITIADAKTGEILGFIRIRPDGGVFDDAEKTYGAAIDDEFATMNLGSARKKAGPRPYY